MTDETYRQYCEAFNQAAGAAYIPEIHFLTFRKTKKGILVGYTVGKRAEVRELRGNVIKAGEPYYMKEV